MEYKCPECGEIMAVYGEPQEQLQSIDEIGTEFPTKVVCSRFNFYHCPKCNIKISKITRQNYIKEDDIPDHINGL